MGGGRTVQFRETKKGSRRYNSVRNDDYHLGIPNLRTTRLYAQLIVFAIWKEVLRKREEAMDREREQLVNTVQELRGQVGDRHHQIEAERREIR